MFQQFRSRYPTGSMTSELLEIHEGTYVVRVSLHSEGLVLITALAGAETVEQAEDHARERALAALDLLSAAAKSAEFPKRMATTSGEQVDRPPLQSVQSSSSAEPSLPAPSPSPTLKLVQRDTAQPVESPFLDEGSGQRSGPSLASANLAGPIDMSDVIAQTSVEIKRLCWTEEQGREYLRQTYGKRSRQHLTDEELVDFLHHLQQQPSP